MTFWLSDRGFKLAFGLALLIKLALAAAVPMTGDEAYFIVWAKHPALGFYDHPPLIGWMLWLLLNIGDHPVIMRLPSIVAGLLIAGLIWRILKPLDETKARLIALIALFSPPLLITVLVTTDTLLILFGFLSTALLYRALLTGQKRFFALCGIALGLAFLSKYFAVLLALGFFAYFLLFARKHWRGFLLLFAAVIPFGLQNLYYNYHECWYNILFNTVNRQVESGFNPLYPPLFLVSLIYLVSPALVWYFAKERQAFRADFGALKLFAWAALIPLAVFFLLSFSKLIGLHWIYLFAALLTVAGFWLSSAALIKTLRFNIVFSALHLLLIGAVLLIPLGWLKGQPDYPLAVFHLKGPEVAQALEPFKADFYATGGYTPSAVLAYHGDHDWAVFGPGSRYAREDDRITDWRKLAGQTMLYFEETGKAIRRDRIDPYFERVEYRRVEIAGASYEIALAAGFNYEAYKGGVLTRCKEQFYQIPAFLPVGGCQFLERYFETPRPF